MYIVERLKKDFPEHTETLETFDSYLHRYHNDCLLKRVYDDGKWHFHWIEEAFKCGPGNPDYNKYMTYYQAAIGFDRDYLEAMTQDRSGTTIEDLRKALLGTAYNLEYDIKLMEKLKTKE